MNIFARIEQMLPMRYMLFFTLASMILSCKPGSDSKQGESKLPDKMELMEADRNFSSMSKAKGMKTAFIEYLDSNGVLLRPGNAPIEGANAIDYLLRQNDSRYTLTWDPRKAEIARSGELGFTYGVFALHPKTEDTVIYGTYVSIWKRQQDGKWKLLLDSGNEGLSE